MAGTSVGLSVRSSGTAYDVDAAHPLPVVGTVTSTPSGTQAVSNALLATGVAGLGKAEDAAHTSGDVGVQMLGVTGPTTPAAAVSAYGDYSYFKTDREGNQVVTLNSISDVTWQGVATATTTTPVVVRAAAAAGIRNYLTDVTVSNSAAAGVLVTLLDGVTVIWQTWLAPGTSIDGAFVTPLRGTAATALNVNLSVATASVYVAVAGYTGV